MRPALRIFRTTDASKSGTFRANALHEYVVRMPAVLFRSLIGIGTPWNGPSRAARRFVDDGHVCVQLRVEPLDPLEVERGQFCGRELVCAHARRQLEGGREREVVTTAYGR